MTFWIICIAMAVLSAAILWRTAREARGDDGPAAAYDLKVYRDQLAEVDRDLDRGVIPAEDADRVRTEISRRILAADTAMRDAAQAPARSGRSMGLMAVAGLAIVAGSALVYRQLGAPGYGDLALQDRIEMAQLLRESRPSQAEAEASLDPGSLPPTPAAPDYADLVAQLRSVVAERPGDARGMRLLAVTERNLGNYAAAHAAFARLLELRGDAAQAAEYADYADALILAAGGYVSPQAEAALAAALERAPSLAPARYYWGLMLLQTGRPDQAFRIWDALLREGPADAPWIGVIQMQIEDAALRAGVNYTMPQPGTGRAPSAADIEAAGDMSPSERMEMIEGMVSGLATRLSEEGGPPQDWAQLITALGVLGRTADAYNVYQNAIRVFADDPGALDAINRAGESAGVTN